jgi:O-antigen ligase
LQQLAKMILLIQFILPVFALPLGQSYVTSDTTALRIDIVLFTVAVVVMVAEVLATWVQGSLILTPYLFLFSVYQHLQYVPALMLVLFGLGLPAVLRHDKWRPWVIASAPVCAVYATASVSMLALGLAVGCLSGGAWFLWVIKRRQSAVLWVAVFAVSMFGSFQIVKTAPISQLKLAERAAWTDQADQSADQADQSASGNLPLNVKERLHYWSQYWSGITQTPRTLLLGHVERPDRKTSPSAHNYYLDLVYNFGIVALLPFLFLIYRSAKLAWGAIRSRNITTELFWLLGAVAFFALIDNSLKVGFRQPYPGIVMFFLWGVLLTRLSAAVAARRA